MESDGADRPPDEPALRVRLLGPMAIDRGGIPLTLPGSRKVRALLAYLAVAAQAVTRSQLCELLWDVPNDPRAELRWCLSKIRNLLDDPVRPRVIAIGDAVRLDLSDCQVDAIDIARAADAGYDSLAPGRLQILSVAFHGDFGDGLEIDRSAVFTGWLTAQRRRFRSCHVALLEQLVRSAPESEVLVHLEKWLELSPFDRHVHETLLTTLARTGRIREGEEHLAAAVRLFDAEGLDCGPLHHAWRSARAAATGSTRDLQGPSPVLATIDASPNTVPTATPRRASIAVMPFADHSAAPGASGGTAGALAHDVITRLAKLRSMFVIAQGTVFALHDRRIGAEDAGRMLDVDYIVSGSVRCQQQRLTVAVQLAETRSARVVWAETFDRRLDDAFAVLAEIGDRIVASIASEVEMVERNRAVLRPPNSLDAWEAHHRGLWHMYRFSEPENERARHFFQMAVRLDPTFSRAYAGLSFTHFQTAFQGWASRGPEIDRAFEAAGQSVMADDRDPAAHWAMGRALWLRGQHDQSVIELERAVDLSPNFALAHYNLAFVHSTAGDPLAAISASDHSRDLSPFDPMLFGMLGTRAMALVRLGRFDEAAAWAVKAAARPNAFPHIRAIAAYSLALAGSVEDARSYIDAIHRTLPGYGVQDFLGAFRFDDDGAALFVEGARRIGMS